MIITLSLFAIGYVLTGLMRVRSKTERFGLGFFLAFGLVGFSLFCLTSNGVRLDRNIAFVVVGLACVSLLFSIKDIVSVRIKGWWWLIVMLIGLSLLINLYWPPNTWDALTLYDFRAKLFSSGFLYSDLYQNLSEYNANFGYYVNGYPPLTSLVASLSYLLNESAMPLFTGVFATFVFLFYHFMEKYSSKKIGIVFTLILASTAIIFYHSTIFYSNLFFSASLALSSIYLFDFSKTKNKKSLLFCYLLLILSSWTRTTEPFYVIIFFLSLVVTISDKKFLNILLCIFLIVLTLYSRFTWQVYINNFNSINKLEAGMSPSSIIPAKEVVSVQIGYINGLTQIFTSFDSTIIQEIIVYVEKSLDIYKYLLFSFFIVSLSRIKYSFANVVFWFVVLSFLIMIAGVISFSITVPFWEELVDSARRMMIFTIPCMLFFIGTAINNSKDDNRN